MAAAKVAQETSMKIQLRMSKTTKIWSDFA
jgi:hypothetical protein